jgi:hypothetical protein
MKCSSPRSARLFFDQTMDVMLRKDLQNSRRVAARVWKRRPWRPWQSRCVGDPQPDDGRMASKKNVGKTQTSMMLQVPTECHYRIRERVPGAQIRGVSYVPSVRLSFSPDVATVACDASGKRLMASRLVMATMVSLPILNVDCHL